MEIFVPLSHNIAPGLETSPAEMCLEQLDVELPMATGGDGTFDAVGWILSSKTVFVQVGTREQDTEGFDVMEWLGGGSTHEEGSEALPNVERGQGGYAGLQDWGYTVGQLAGRAPVVLPAEERVPMGCSSQSTAIQTALLFHFLRLCVGGICSSGIQTHCRFLDAIEEREHITGQVDRLPMKLQMRG